MKGNTKKYALITGASKGLGKAIAIELASEGINLLLVALKGEGLQKLCANIEREYKVETKYLEVNLVDPFAVHRIAEWVKPFHVNMLINNAGVGGSKSFESAGLEYLDSIISINIRTVSLLTYLILPKLRQHARSYILNVSSMASFSPMAFKTVYPASKSFVYSFSRCLKEELKNTNVSVSVLHPGPMITNDEIASRIEIQGQFAKMGILTPAEVAEIAIREMYRSKAMIIPGYINKMNWLLMKITPASLRVPLISKVVKRELAA